MPSKRKRLRQAIAFANRDAQDKSTNLLRQNVNVPAPQYLCRMFSKADAPEGDPAELWPGVFGGGLAKAAREAALAASVT